MHRRGNESYVSECSSERSSVAVNFKTHVKLQDPLKYLPLLSFDLELGACGFLESSKFILCADFVRRSRNLFCTSSYHSQSRESGWVAEMSQERTLLWTNGCLASGKEDAGHRCLHAGSPSLFRARTVKGAECPHLPWGHMFLFPTQGITCAFSSKTLNFLMS